MILGITNYLNENIENVNIQIEKIQEKINENDLHIFIFHDNNYEQSYHKYESFKNLMLITENQNKGTLYGRIQIIKMIPDNFNNEFLIWLDADDQWLNIDILLSLIEKYKEYDYVTPFITTTCLWSKFIKVGAYKEAISNFKLYPNLRVCAAECFIITAALLDLCYKNKIKWLSEYYPEWISYSGGHQTFNISDDFNQDASLRKDIEELVQWTIWKVIEKPNFNITVKECDFIYNNYMQELKKLDKIHDSKIIHKINNLINEIIFNMPDNYKTLIKKNLIF